jgi:hypothetical protein
MTAQTDHLSFSSLGMATQNIRCSAFFEDLLLDSVQKISTLAIPTTTTKSEISEFSKPMIFADVWLEINGPPTQRYIQPNTNLALASLDIKPQVCEQFVNLFEC